MKLNFTGGKVMDIGALVIVAGAVLILPLMYLIRYVVIEKKTGN